MVYKYGDNGEINVMVHMESVFVAPHSLEGSRDIFGEKMWHESGFWETTHAEPQVPESNQHAASTEDTRIRPS